MGGTRGKTTLAPKASSKSSGLFFASVRKYSKTTTEKLSQMWILYCSISRHSQHVLVPIKCAHSALTECSWCESVEGGLPLGPGEEGTPDCGRGEPDPIRPGPWDPLCLMLLGSRPAKGEHFWNRICYFLLFPEGLSSSTFLCESQQTKSLLVNMGCWLLQRSPCFLNNSTVLFHSEPPPMMACGKWEEMPVISFLLLRHLTKQHTDFPNIRPVWRFCHQEVSENGIQQPRIDKSVAVVQ